VAAISRRRRRTWPGAGRERQVAGHCARRGEESPRNRERAIRGVVCPDRQHPGESRKAKAELQRREQGPSAGGAPGPRSMATWWREFQAHADAVDLAIEREHQAAIRDGQPWPPERTPEAGHEESATAAPGRESQLGQAQSGVSSPLAGPEPSAPEPGTPESEAAGPVPPMTGAPPGWISCRPARTKRRRGSTRSGQKSRPAASTPRGSNARPRPDRRLTGRWKRPTKWNCKRSGRTGVTFKSHDTWIHTP
jgi:hypothetical protein